MKKKKVPVSLLIPTMNRPDSLKQTLASYFDAEVIPMQLVVVDQSKDETIAENNRKIVESYDSACTVCYIYQEIPSLTKARNRAFEYACQEIIICSDDDIDVNPDTLNYIYELMKDKNLAMIAGLDRNMKLSGGKIGYLLGTKSFKYRKIGHVTKSMLGRFPEEIHGQVETMWAMGFFCVFRRSLIQKWKIEWDEKLLEYAYAEDLDFSYTYYKRARAERLRCIMDERVTVDHRASQEYRTPTRKSTYMYVINRYYLAYKHHQQSLRSVKWCNYMMILKRAMAKENYKDLVDAEHYVHKEIEKIKKGKLGIPV